MPHKDPIARSIYKKEYYEKNKEKEAIRRKVYFKEYREKNKEKLKEYFQTPTGKQSNSISKWKSQGIHVEDMQILYKWYNEATHCKNCKKKFKGGKRNNLTKCIDHDHNLEFNNFRAILCSSCNVNLRDDNISGIPNVHLKKNGNWIYQRKINKIRHYKTFKTKNEALAYKIEFEATRIYFHQ